VLATLAAFHGLRISLARARDLVGLDRSGTGMVQIREAAIRLGFRANFGKAKAARFEEIPLPAIAHLKGDAGGHYVVIYDIRPNHLTIADPGEGLRSWSRAEFDSRWTGHVLLAAPGPEFRATSASDRPGSLLVRLAWGQRRILMVAVLLGLVVSALSTTQSLFIQLALDRVMPGRNVGLLTYLAVFAISLIVVQGGLSALRGVWLERMARRLEADGQVSLISHLLALPIRFFDIRSIGDLHRRTSDVTAVNASIRSSILEMCSDLLMFIIALTFMFAYDARLTCWVVVQIPVVIAVSFLLQRPLQRVQREVIRIQSQATTCFVDSFSTIRLVKGFGAEEVGQVRLALPWKEFAAAVYRQRLWALAATILIDTPLAIIAIIVLWVGSNAVLDGSLSVGRLVFFSSSLAMLLGPVHRLAWSGVQLQEGYVAAERLVDVFSAPIEQSPDATTRIESCRGDVELEDVRFSYREGYPVLTDVGLHIPAGSTVALVGETGSGKTTLASLIAGFYVAQGGRVSIDGHDMRQIDLASYRQHLGVVLQDNYLLSDTIRANIALGKPDATLEEVIGAARLARADDFVSRLPGQYECQVGDRGVLLSSGQRQRIAIARAFLRDPAIMILDEATNNLDSETESVILDALFSHRRGRTTVVVAHRLSTVMRADLIVVLREGRVVELGTHAALMDARGMYHGLWMHQAPMLTTASG
jgi:ABC-type bacteriocin/lantibiotic exporter with double-glycine peptidase domain